nr:MAG TPA: hypothetical protein [Caudoviricetes sp.]
MIPRNSEFEVVFGYPKPGRDRVFVIVPVGWEYENESSDIVVEVRFSPSIIGSSLEVG